MRGLWVSMAVHLWQTTLVLGLLLVLERLLRRAPARFHSALWLAGLIKILLPLPLLAALLRPLAGLFTWEEQTAVGATFVTVVRVVGLAPVAEGVARPSASPLPDLLFGVLTLLWAVGLIALLFLWWRRSVGRWGRGVTLEEVAADLRQKLEQAAAGTAVPLEVIRISDAPTMPCVRGLIRPVLFLPKVVLEEMSRDELRAILVHEDAHRRRRDLWRTALGRTVAFLFFFYPPVWWLARRLSRAAELACDEAVLLAGVTPQIYARALSRTVTLGLHTAAPGLNGGRANTVLKARIARIREPGRYVAMSRHKFAVLLAFALVGLLSVVALSDSGMAMAGDRQSQQIQQTQQVQQIQEDQQLQQTQKFELAEKIRWVLQLKLAQSAQEAQPLKAAPLFREGFKFQLTEPIKADPRFLQLQEGVPIAAGQFGLRDLSGADSLVTLSYRREEATEILDELASLGGFQVEYEGREPVGRVTLGVVNSTIEQTLDMLADLAGLSYEVTDPATLVVRQQALRVGEDIAEPTLVHRVNPEYPEEARKAGIEGAVVLEVTIDQQGDVRHVEVVRSLDPVLDQAAVAAVSQWRYNPSLYGGTPVAVIATITVVFELVR